MACNVDVNSNVVFSMGKIGLSGEMNFKAFSLGVDAVLMWSRRLAKLAFMFRIK